MREDSQILVPDSFIDLFRPPGARAGAKLRERPEVIAERYELCEDMAQMLVEQARERCHALGVEPSDVLARMEAGLVHSEVVTADEAQWVVRRLAELLG